MPKLFALLLAASLIGQDCPPSKICLRIPAPLYARAQLKARLVHDLIQSLKNDQDGIYDIPLEREITSLEVKLSGERK